MSSLAKKSAFCLTLLTFIRKSTLNRQEGQEFKQSQKSRILEYQFDDYDDEYDDTYDSSDIKLADATEIDALDTPVPAQPPNSNTNTPDPSRAYEYLLVQYYQSDPALFISSRRKTPDRAQLKTQTGLSDEQIEGWAKMLERNVGSFLCLLIRKASKRSNIGKI